MDAVTKVKNIIMKILGIDTNAKTRKGQKRGYMTGITYLAPSDASGEINTCPNASKGCRAACLFTSGRGRMNPIKQARINKTKFFAKEKKVFMTQLDREILSLVKRASKHSKTPCVRLNGTSDLPWENIKLDDGRSIMEKWEGLQFYDYTKSLTRIANYANGKLPSNYHLTFSRSEDTGEATVKDILNRGVNVAVVYKDTLPIDDFDGVEVLNGDADDLRFLDPISKIVGLVYKSTVATPEEWNGFVREYKEGEWV